MQIRYNIIIIFIKQYLKALLILKTKLFSKHVCNSKKKRFIDYWTGLSISLFKATFKLTPYISSQA